MKRRVPVDPAIEPKRRCAIYTRKSTTHGLDTEFSSLDAQWEACAGYVRGQRDWELVPERYDDGGFTGANLERPAFQRLMADVEAGRVDVVVVYKIDRLSRSLLDFASLMERFRKVGAYFVSVTQPFLSADSDAMAQLLLNVLMAFAQFERQMIAERIRDKVVASRRKGLWTGGNIPFGYQVEGRKLRPEPLEAAMVREMFDAYEREPSDCALARELTARKLATRKGRAWTPQSVARVLTNPVYAGYVTLGEERHEGEHEPLIARERFEKHQRLRATKTGPGCHADHASRQRNPEYLLRGVLFCACTHRDGSACGYALTPSSTRKGTKTYRFYRCIARDKTTADACPARPLAAREIEEVVREQIANVTRRLDARRSSSTIGLTSAVESNVGARVSALKNRESALRRALKEWDEGDDEPKDNRSRGGRAEKQRESLQTELVRVCEERSKLERLLLDGSWIAEQLRNFERVWDHLLPMNRLRVVRLVVERVEVNSLSGEVAVTLQRWVSEALAAAKGDDAA